MENGTGDQHIATIGDQNMLLKTAKVGPFRSINEEQEVAIDEKVTVLVGMNEAGKTVFLKAIEKSADALGLAVFDPVEDYPRKDLPTYLRTHKTKPAAVTHLRYLLTDDEVNEINEIYHTSIPLGFSFSVAHRYDNSSSISLDVDEKPAISALISDSKLSADARSALRTAESIREIPGILSSVSLTDEDKKFVTQLETRIEHTRWPSIIKSELWNFLKKKMPKCLYFGDYELLPSKTNLKDLSQRLESSKNDSTRLKSEHRSVLALLRMADISLADFADPSGYESLKAKLEGVSINLTDQIMEFWKQNEDLEVEVDIRSDDKDESPYCNGPNLYLRIKNRRHRGVSTPFRQRSRGFIWFFSFLVWFDSVQHQLTVTDNNTERPLILLLDEPGLSLHALAQYDFLRYIDKLSEKHQIIYTTHSPFMVHADRLAQIRMVEDRQKIGTVIFDTLDGTDARTIFPLQAALGWTIAQSLFISERNLVVEGPSELLYLRSISAILDGQGRTGLRGDITIVPAGGLDKLVTFIALLGANGLKLSVLHDYRGFPEQKLQDLAKQKLINAKSILNASQFRDVENLGTARQASDIEDLLDEEMYLDCFNRAFAKQLNGRQLTPGDLPFGDRIVSRLEKYLDSAKIQLRPSGGFNHLAVASQFSSYPPASLPENTVKRFETLFRTINSLF